MFVMPKLHGMYIHDWVKRKLRFMAAICLRSRPIWGSRLLLQLEAGPLGLILQQARYVESSACLHHAGVKLQQAI